MSDSLIARLHKQAAVFEGSPVGTLFKDAAIALTQAEKAELAANRFFVPKRPVEPQDDTALAPPLHPIL
jgi:hypothetical protein